MAKYLVEFKQADSEGYIHTRRTFPDLIQAVNEAKAAMNGLAEFEYLIVRRIKEKVVPVKKEAGK